MLGAFWMVVANAAVLLGAHAVLRRIRTGTPALDAVLFLLLRFLIITVVVLAAGLAGALNAAWLGAIGAGALAALLAAGEQRRIPRFRPPDLSRFTLVILGLVALRLLLQVWFFAPFGTDALSYHLPKMAEWIRAGRILHAPGTDVRETFPAGFELLEAWWTVFLHHDVLIEMAGVEFLALAFAAVASLGRTLGLAPRAAATAGLLYLLTPGVHLLAVSCMNDAPVAALFLSSAALIVARAHPALVLIPVGLGMGMKPTFAYLAPGLLLLFWAFRSGAALRTESMPAAVAGAALSLATGAFWYVRNFALFGSPIHPVGRTPLIEPMPPLAGAAESLARRLLLLVDSGVTDRAESYTSLLALGSGWGVAAFSAGAVALLVRLREDGPLRRLAAGFALSLCCAYLLSHPKFYVYRFILFFPALFALALAALAEQLALFSGLARILTLLLLLATCFPHDLLPHFSRMTSQDWRARTFEDPSGPVPPADPVACLYGVNADVYIWAAPDFHRPIVSIRDASSVDDLRDQLRSRGIRWIHAQGDPESPRLKPLLRQSVQAGILKRHGAWLYERIDP